MVTKIDLIGRVIGPVTDQLAEHGISVFVPILAFFTPMVFEMMREYRNDKSQHSLLDKIYVVTHIVAWAAGFVGGIYHQFFVVCR